MKEKNVNTYINCGSVRDLAFERLGILAYAIRFGGVAASDIIKGELIKTNFVRKMWANADAKEKRATAKLLGLGVSQEDIIAMIKEFAQETKGRLTINVIEAEFSEEQAKVTRQKIEELTRGRVCLEMYVTILQGTVTIEMQKGE